MAAILCIRRKVYAEVRKYKQKALKLGDFSVEIKHLPKLDICANVDLLRAKLALHIAKVVEEEDDVLELKHEHLDSDISLEEGER